MFFLGVGVAIVGATARAVGLTPSEIGYLIAAQNVGFGIAVLVGGVLADRYRKPVILAAGLVMLGASFALLYRSPLFVVNLAIMLLMGLGMGSVEAVTDAWLLELHTRNESRLVTINHFFVSVGSVVITLYLMAMQLDWERSLVQVTVVLGVLAILVAFLRPSGREQADATAPGESLRSASGERGPTFARIVRDPGMLLLFLGAMGSIGVGIGSGGVMTTFAAELRGVATGRAQGVLAFFLVGLAAGRIAVGVLDRGRRPARTAIVAATAAFVASSLLYFVPLPDVTLEPIAFTLGLTVAPLLPITIALAGLRYRRVAGTAMGVVKLAIPVGGIVVPGLLGLLADALSFQSSLVLLPVSALIVLVVTLLGEREARR